MITTTFRDDTLSLLGFGAMRLPQKPDGSIDEAQVDAMVDMAIAGGVNYFDTAYPYHGGMSEIVMGRSLARYPRESWKLASKYPGHQIAASYDPAAIFEEQLKKCGVEYFDYYLLHNVYEKSIDVYMDEKWGILDYFKEQKRLGRIRHLGFSTHGSTETIERFLDYAGDAMEFCQIQLNYLDWSLQDAESKYEVLAYRGIPVWVMEPIHGGKLASLTPDHMEALDALHPGRTAAEWSFRFIQGLPNVQMVLSGMSTISQMEENLRTFDERITLNDAETRQLMRIAEKLKNSVPCTGCRYCTDGCPMQLEIPELLAIYNEIRLFPVTNVAMRVEALPEDKRPTACIGCGACTKICPQNIDIPLHLREFGEVLKTIPSWEQICRERAEAARKLKEGK